MEATVLLCVWVWLSICSIFFTESFSADHNTCKTKKLQDPIDEQ